MRNRINDYVQKPCGYDLLKLRSVAQSKGDTGFWTSMNGHRATGLLTTVCGPRWRLDLHQGHNEDGKQFHVVFLTGDMGEGVYRSRHMSDELFIVLTDVVMQSHQSLSEMLGELNHEEIPRFPNCGTLEVYKDEVVRVTIGLCKDSKGKISTTLAICDADDEFAPVVLALDDEIEQFAADFEAIRSRLFAETAPSGTVVFKASSGSVVGVVEEPLEIDESKTYREQLVVKIGSLQGRKKVSQSQFNEDSKRVVEKLRAYCLSVKSDGPSAQVE